MAHASWRCRGWRSSPPTRHGPATRHSWPCWKRPSATRSPHAPGTRSGNARRPDPGNEYNARMKTKTLPVALIQERAIIDQGDGNAEANLAVIERRVAEAASAGARLVLLQELHNGAYFC